MGHSTLYKLKPLWTSRMPRATKVGVLTAAVESVLMYGSESWTLTETLTKRLDGLYTLHTPTLICSQCIMERKVDQH